MPVPNSDTMPVDQVREILRMIPSIEKLTMVRGAAVRVRKSSGRESHQPLKW